MRQKGQTKQNTKKELKFSIRVPTRFAIASRAHMVDQINPIVKHNQMFHSILTSILYYDVTERSRFSYLREMANQCDLTLQGGPNSHDM